MNNQGSYINLRSLSLRAVLYFVPTACSYVIKLLSWCLVVAI